MKKLVWLVAASCIAANCAFAVEENSVVNCHLTGGIQIGDTFNGPTECLNTVVDNLTVNGPLKLASSVIKGNLTVQGPLDLANTVVKGDVVVHGPLKSLHGTYEVAMVYGPLDSDQSVFKDELTLFAEHNKLLHSIAQDIVVKKTNELATTQTLYLTNTVVKGNISFESGKGRVVVDDKSVISGKVSGGKVEKAEARTDAAATTTTPATTTN